MGVLEFYKGKTVLISGTTGFLGKVILEKFLRSIPDVKQIYILIRKKKGSSTMERFKKEVIGSPCFDVLRKMHSNFNEFINSKITPIEGDLLKDGLSLSPEDFKLIVENVNIIINSAASVDFNSPIHDAIRINVRGTLKMFELAKACKNLDNFLHVSTCYVNSEQKSGSWIEEKIYDIDYDAEQKINEIEQLPTETVTTETKKILGPFPNSYTFTKSMCERILMNKKGDVPVTIVRPSIIGSSYKEPIPGWVDSISAAGALYFLGGLGILHAAEGSLSNIGDQIPVDFVSDAIIIAAACYAKSQNLNIVHSGTSTRNAAPWRIAMESVTNYFNKYPPEKQVSKVWFTLIPNEKVFKAYQYSRRVPLFLYKNTAKILNSPTMKKKAVMMGKVLARSETVSDVFKHFTTGEWFFATEKIEELKHFLAPEEQNMFQLDVTKIEWRRYLTLFCWGLQKFVLKENPEQPLQANQMNFLEKHPQHFNDFTWALNQGSKFQPRSNIDMKSQIMSSARVQEVLRKISKQKKDKSISEEQYLKKLHRKGEYLCDSMFATYSMPTIRFMAWSMNKILKSVYERIVVDEASLKRLTSFDQKESGPIVLMPTHRSYMDFLLVSYIFFAYGLKVPHIAAAEDFLSIHIVARLLRASGAFFIRRKAIEHKELYNVILYEYVQRLLIDESWLEFFIEGTRSRAGKMLAPKFGLLNIVTDTYFDHKLPDVQIVPLTINYEKVVEGETFPFELLGESKVKESLSRVAKASSILNQNFGKVYIQFADPISLKAYSDQYTKNMIENQTEKSLVTQEFNPHDNKDNRRQLVEKLGYDIIDTMHQNLVIVPTAIVASVILMHRKGIKEEELIEKVEWIASELVVRGVNVATIHPGSTKIAVKSSLNRLENYLNNKKDIFHPSVSAKSDYKNILMLSYYRNGLLFAFFNEALIACSLMAFGHDFAYKEGVDLNRLFEEVSFLQSLVKTEAVLKNRITKSSIRDYVVLMTRRGVLHFDDLMVKVNVEQDQFISFLCSLIWPFVESYWATAVFLFSLKTKKSIVTPESFLQECQWFTETMYEERMLEFFECCSADTIKNAFSTYKEWNVVKVESRFNDQKRANESYIVLEISEERLHGLEAHIKKFMKYSYATSVRSPIERARKTILVDFPFMAKL